LNASVSEKKRSQHRRSAEKKQNKASADSIAFAFSGMRRYDEGEFIHGWLYKNASISKCKNVRRMQVFLSAKMVKFVDHLIWSKLK
jgi:hypothetical protein